MSLHRIFSCWMCVKLFSSFLNCFSGIFDLSILRLAYFTLRSSLFPYTRCGVVSRSTISSQIDLAFFSIQDLTRLQSFDKTVFDPLLLSSALREILMSHPNENFTFSVARLLWLAAVIMGCLACLASVRAVFLAEYWSCIFFFRSVLNGLFQTFYAFVSTHVANRFSVFMSICEWIGLRVRIFNLFRCLYFFFPRAGLRVNVPIIRYLFLVATPSFSLRRLSRSRKRLPPPTGNLW